MYQFYPVEFCRDVIGVELDAWQQWTARSVARTIRALHGLEEPSISMRHTAVASSTGVGKDMIAACLALWFLLCFVRPKVIITGPSDDQLDDVMWPELAKWISHSPILPMLVEWQAESIVHKGDPTNSFISRRTARIQTHGGERRATGMSGVHEENVFLIGDEAPGIADEIFDALLPTMTDYNNIVLLIGNPERTSGLFYRIWYDMIEADLWQKIRVSSEPWPEKFKGQPDFISNRPTDLEKERWRRKPDEDPIKQAKLWGRHPVESAGNAVYSHDELLEAFGRPMWPMGADDDCQIGIDCARMGGDRTVFVVRRGWNIVDIIERGRVKTPEIVDITKELCEREGAITYWLNKGGDRAERAREFAAMPQIERLDFYPLVVLDLGGGYGTGPLDDLEVEGYTNVTGVNFGESAWDSERYANLAAEMWCDTLKSLMPMLSFEAVKRIDGGKHMLEEIRMQLTQRPYDFTKTDERVRILDKKELRRKGIKSPDHADGLCLCVVKPPTVGVF